MLKARNCLRIKQQDKITRMQSNIIPYASCSDNRMTFLGGSRRAARAQAQASDLHKHLQDGKVPLFGLEKRKRNGTNTVVCHVRRHRCSISSANPNGIVLLGKAR